MIMKKAFYIPLLLILLFTLSGCSSPDTAASGNLIIIEESTGISVENNSLRVGAGEDARFVISTKRGTSITGCDYSGEYDLYTEGGRTVLVLKDLRYPTRVCLELGASSCTISYDANGGTRADGLEGRIDKSYSLNSYHRRPNTSTGSELFYREGYTLTSWNTMPDGSGTRIGLGSRITLLSGTKVLYAIWEKQCPEEDFIWETVNGHSEITGYTGNADILAIPSRLGSCPVTRIRSGAFVNCTSRSVILPSSLETLCDGAFESCTMTELTMSDNLSDFSDASFVNCSRLLTLHINAVEAPYGYTYRKESCYADKLDLLILAEGQKKLVFYGGCSMWYNLDGRLADREFGSEYRIMNLGLNGTVNSCVQLQIIGHFLEDGDILFHAPELSSHAQLMLRKDMGSEDVLLWCGIENNYDLFSYVDMRTLSGVFTSFCEYLGMKDRPSDYLKYFSDDYNTPYYDSYGCIPFTRTVKKERLSDSVSLKLDCFTTESLSTLCTYYSRLKEAGVNVYVSYACLNSSALPEGQEALIEPAASLFSETLQSLAGITPVSDIMDFIYTDPDFYDTNYHLLTPAAKSNTAVWLRDLKVRMISDGLWKEDK